jgi:hypothetical protein
MRRMLNALLLLAILSAGCAPLYPVQIAPMGGDKYVATQTSESSWLDARTSAIKRASAWCVKRGGEFGVIDTAQEREALLLPGTSRDHATVEFQCAGMR